MHTAPYFTAFGLLAILHSWRVSELRIKYKVTRGDGGHADLERRIRVFGNFIEYAPLGLVLLIALEVVQAPIWYLHAVGLTFLAGRSLHAIGFGGRKFPVQFTGMVLTHLSIAIAAVGVSLWTFLGSAT